MKAYCCVFFAALFGGVLCIPQVIAAPSATADIQVQVANPKTIEIIATDYAFAPTEITAAPNEKIKLILINKGKKPHNIRFDFGTTKIQLPEDLKAGESGTLEFTAPAGPGTFGFDCPVGLHEEMGMKGKLITR